MVPGPFGTGTAGPMATTLSSPAFTSAIFTTDGPLGADGFLYLNFVAEPFVLQLPAGRLSVAALAPSSNAIELSDPATGSEPMMVMPGSFDSSTSFDVP